jgi:hypothetical protein
MVEDEFSIPENVKSVIEKDTFPQITTNKEKIKMIKTMILILAAVHTSEHSTSSADARSGLNNN